MGLRRIRIVDHDPHNLRFMTIVLEAAGEVEVSGETRSACALPRIRSERPCLIVLDAKMPEPDGLALLTALRSEGNNVPVVICSGCVNQKEVDQAFSAGCNGYVEKPASLDDYRQMAEAVTNFWRRARLPSCCQAGI